MKILVGYERFGGLREALRELGHDAYSCDIVPAVDGSPFHIQDTVHNLLYARYRWQLAIFHPDCTYLTNSAAWAYNDPDFDRYPDVGYHQRIKPGTLVGAARRAARRAAVNEVAKLWNCKEFIPKIAIENPRGYLSTAWRRPDQTIQPNRFGDDASKATCFWLHNLPKLRPTGWVEPRTGGMPLFGGDGGPMRWANQTDSGQNRLSPGEGRAMDRAKTYPGVLRAMALQWAGAA